MITSHQPDWRTLLDAVRARVRDVRGALLPIMTVGFVLLLSAAAVAVDVGMLMSARTEAQRVADLAALAGAGGLQISRTNDALARSNAIDFALRNEVRKTPVVLEPGDVVVDLAAATVKATVVRTAARGTPVSTIFAKVFGITTVDVRADATAQVSPAGGINCLLPLALPDRWFENVANPDNDPVDYNPEYGDDYTPWAIPGTDPVQTNDPYTGYSIDDTGAEIPLKANGGGGSMNPSWYYPWRPPGQAGGNDYRTNINSCVDPTIEYSINMVVDSEPGSMNGPTLQGFNDLIAMDPSAAWNATQNCVTDLVHSTSSNPVYCRTSPRVRPVPLFDPTQEPDPGAKPFTFTNFAGLFVDRIQGNTVYAYFVGFAGVDPGGAGTGATLGPLFTTVRLIE